MMNREVAQFLLPQPKNYSRTYDNAVIMPHLSSSVHYAQRHLRFLATINRHKFYNKFRFGAALRHVQAHGKDQVGYFFISLSLKL